MRPIKNKLIEKRIKFYDRGVRVPYHIVNKYINEAIKENKKINPMLNAAEFRRDMIEHLKNSVVSVLNSKILCY